VAKSRPFGQKGCVAPPWLQAYKRLWSWVSMLSLPLWLL